MCVCVCCAFHGACAYALTAFVQCIYKKQEKGLALFSSDLFLSLSPPPHRGPFLFKMFINKEPMIAKIVVRGLGKTHFRDFKKPKILTAVAACSFYCDFHFGPNEFFARAFSQKMGKPKKPLTL